MEINEAIDTMKRLRIALATVNVDGKRVLEPISMAIEALEKQIPKKTYYYRMEPCQMPLLWRGIKRIIG